MANPSAVVQLYQNLLSNAVKFAADRPWPFMSARTREECEWKFIVQDNGIGMQPSISTAYFGIFQRIETSSERPGTESGWQTARRSWNTTVEGSGWSPEPGKGSTFFFTIPDRT